MKTPAKQRGIQIGSEQLQYELVHSKRKTLAIQVFADGRVIVRAPSGSPIDKIEAFIRQKAKWILQHQKRFKEYVRQVPAMRRYASGETYYFLGEAYTLQIEPDASEYIELDDGCIKVHVQNIEDQARIARLIDKWFRAQAARILPERLAACFPRVQVWGVAYPPITIRPMKSRWGSCRSNGKITLNLSLIHVSVDLIDYIVLHELCHLREMNHSRAFYALMDSVLPDWREKRERLKKTPIL